MNQIRNALRWTLFGVCVGVAIGAALNERAQRHHQQKESEAFWNSPYMLEQRREHEERMKKDPLYRMQWQEMEARHDL